MSTKKLEKTSEKFVCEPCDFKCCYTTDWDRHITRLKHKKNEISTNNQQKNIKTFICNNCNKEYKERTGLYRHKQKCIIENTEDNLQINTEDKNDSSDKELINLLIKENTDFKNLILDVCKNFQSSIVNNNTSTNNSHNKTFNLQVFLNETCKDAMNIMDFADSIKLQLTDLENVGEYGFVNGISKIIIKNLQEMDVNLRPVHCSDLKREVAYVKENGIWEKDSPDNKLIKKAIKRVANRNIRQITEWKKLYPDCGLSDSKKSNQYNELVIEAMGGRGDDDEGKANKIVKKIMKNVVIDKNML